MRSKSLIYLAFVAVLGIAVGLLGFWFGGHNTPFYDSAAWANDEKVGQNNPDNSDGGQVSEFHQSSTDKQMYDTFFQFAKPVTKPSTPVASLVLPHHMAAGYYVAGVFNALNNLSPPVVVVISPNHHQAGSGFVASGRLPWQTPYGNLEVAGNNLSDLEKENMVTVDESALEGEHGIGALVPFIKKTWPKTKILPLIVKPAENSVAVDSVANKLASTLPPNSLVIASVDFSHYLPKEVANYHDELSIAVLERGGIERTKKLEVDSPNSLRFLLRYNSLKSSQNFNLAYHTNSADIMGQPELKETTSHVLGYFTAGEPKRDDFLSLQFFGDMMLERNVQKSFGKDGLDYVFKNLRAQENRFFYGADWLVANLEGPFAPARVYTTKSIAFRFDPKLALQLKKYNFGAFSLANNHSLDMGVKNYTFTQKILEQNGLKYFGHQTKQGKDYNLLVGEKDGLPEDVAFVAYNDVGSPINKAKVKEAIDDAKTKAKYVIAWPHWGAEYGRISSKAQREMAHWLIDQGVTAVIGNHAHVIQEMELYKGRPIFYALGNFVFDQYFSKDTQEGISVGMTFENGNVKTISVFPFYSVKSQNQLMAGKRKEDFFTWWNKNSRLDGKQFVEGKLEL